MVASSRPIRFGKIKVTECVLGMGVFMRLLFLLAFSVLSLNAQIVSGDGSVVYFFSNLIPRGGDLPTAVRLYRYTAGSGVEPEASLQLDGRVDRLGTLETSADASVVSYWSLRTPLSPNPFCLGQPCYYPITFTGHAGPLDAPSTFNRAVTISRSGRYAVLFDDSAPPERVDRITGERFTAPGTLASPRQTITDDGTMLLAAYPGDNTSLLSLASPSGTRPLATIAFGHRSSY